MLALALTAASPLVAADAPRIDHGSAVTVTASGDLRRQIESRDGWVAYEIPTAEHSMNCGWNGDSSRGDDWRSVSVTSMVVWYRVAEHAIERIRVAPRECGVDAHGAAVTWLDGVDPRASMAVAEALIDSDRSRVAKDAVFVLAMHRDSVEPLLAIAKHHREPHIRADALFWLAQAAGKKAAGALRDAVDNDPDTSVKERAVFGISQLPNEQSIPLLIDLMNTNRNPMVRKRAVFWLGQKDDPRAVAAIEALLRR